MKIPEAVFPIVNAIMRTLLRSPLHRVMSSSILVIHYQGRRSGRALATPVRYQRLDGRLRCTTATHTQWWRNVAENPGVSLLVAGSTGDYQAVIHREDRENIEKMLCQFLAEFPQDAAYQNIRLNKDKSLNEQDLATALQDAIIVDFVPVTNQQ